MSKGWFIAIAPKRQEAPEFFAPLSYGKGREPAHDMLLMRGRASVFPTEFEAWAAAKDTCTRVEDEGDTWPSKYSFVAIEVTE